VAQLVGSSCVICQQRIVSLSSAKFCDGCGNPVHRQCIAQRPAGSEAGRCSRCGGDPKRAPIDRPIQHHNAPAVVTGVVVLLLVGLVFMLWPRPPKRPATAEGTTTKAGSAPAATSNGDNPVVEIETSLGKIRVRLFADKAPQTVANFLDLVKQQFYDGIIFHRVIKDFMIQTGDPKGNGTGGRTDKGLPPKHLADEFHPDLRHSKAGILSMANAGPNTGDTQFFITCKATSWLDDRHAVFGQVISGMEVVHAIENLPTGPNDRPLLPPKIVAIRLLEGETTTAAP
jgi:cyclophilin family peptidyl-prolyl cis-trans isomerase